MLTEAKAKVAAVVLVLTDSRNVGIPIPLDASMRRRNLERMRVILADDGIV